MGHQDPTFSGISRYVDRLDAGLRERGVNVIRLWITLRGLASRALAAARHIGWDLNTFFSRYPLRLAWPPADLFHLMAHTYAAQFSFSRPPGATVVTVHDIGPFLSRESRAMSGYGHPVHKWFDAIAVRSLAAADQILDGLRVDEVDLDRIRAGRRSERIQVTHLGVDHGVVPPL